MELLSNMHVRAESNHGLQPGEQQRECLSFLGYVTGVVLALYVLKVHRSYW